MTILVVGAGKAATSVAGTLEAYHHPVQHCQNASMARPLLNHYAQRYSLILCEQGCESEMLLQHLKRLERDTPVVTIGTPDAMGAGEMAAATSAAGPVCGVYQTADGCQQLRCALSEASARPTRHPQFAQALEEQPVAFAYNAPMNRRR
ncbi:MAG: hypothetical protein WD382_08690 [Halofilum sp. (in: g-proteobacteria)]